MTKEKILLEKIDEFDEFIERRRL